MNKQQTGLDIKSKIGLSLLVIILACAVFIGIGFPLISSFSLVYEGQRQFATMSEALNYENMLADISTAHDATLICELVKTSPPTVSWRISVAHNEFLLYPRENLHPDIEGYQNMFAGWWIALAVWSGFTGLLVLVICKG